MIPIKLTIQGLYSYQDAQTIDFTRLTSAKLFGIFGAVGSGKSSVLEAITFAIYGKTDRLNLSGDNRNYNMMNLKSNDLFIEFDFETGKAQTAYRAVVRGRRNGKKFEEVKTLERSAYKKENGSWIPIGPETLESAIGLSYDNFKRTIIIPQGQFQEFLQLGNKDRTQMMKELFNLGKFEFFYKVTSLENKNNAQKQIIEGQLKQLGELDPEQIKYYMVRLADLKAEIEKLNQQIAVNQKREAELKNLQELVRKKDETQLKLKMLDEKLPEIQVLEKKVADYEYCLVHFKNLFETFDQTLKKTMQLEVQIKNDTVRQKELEARMQATEQLFESVKIGYDERDKLKQKAEELEKMARLTDLKQLVVVLEERIKKGNLIVEDTAGSIEVLKSEKEKLELRLREEKQKQPDMLALSNAKSWHYLFKNLQQQLAGQVADNLKITNEIKNLDESVANLWDAEIFASFSGEKDGLIGSQFLKAKIEDLKNQLNGLDTEIQHFNVQLKLEEFALKLSEGEACPVCGSLHHPEIMNVAHVSEALKKTKVLKSAIEKQIADCDSLAATLTERYHRRKMNEEQLTGALARQKELEEKIRNHQLLFQWEKFRKEEAVIEAFKSADILKRTVDELEKQLEAIVKKIDQEIANKEKYIQNIEKIRTELTVSQTELTTLAKQILLVDRSLYLGKSKEEIIKEKENLLQKYAELERQFRSLNDQLVELRKSRDTLSGSLKANQIQLDQEKKSLDELNLFIEKALKDSDFQTAENVKLILKQQLNIVEEKQKINRFRQDVSITRNQLELMIGEIGSRQYDIKIHEDLRTELSNSNELLSGKNKEYGVTEKSLSDLQKAMKAQVDLRKTLDDLDVRGENIKTMKSLFKASGFVNYISSVYLQNLCNAANDRFFQLTRQKLSLEITDDNSFQVRDYLNGGKIRNVKTLSGGQTFQAALSLALALADNIQKITESNQNFFFLDEGFGSLDKDSLSVVFETLKSLRKENRIVGVISHVEEMQQEIDTHLRIENTEERGSLIERSWEN